MTTTTSSSSSSSSNNNKTNNNTTIPLHSSSLVERLSTTTKPDATKTTKTTTTTTKTTTTTTTTTTLAQLAATVDYHRNPTSLIRAVSARYPTPLPYIWRYWAWFLALMTPSLFYIGPFMLIAPPFLYRVSPTLSITFLVVDVFLLLYPHRPWPWFRSIYQIWYDLFDCRHNLQVNPNDPSQPLNISNVVHDKTANTLAIAAMHPHGIIPIQGFLWMAFCDQYLPTMYGFGATTDAALCIPLLRQVIMWGTAGSASRQVLYQGLEQGQNLFLLPGGVAEIFLSRPGTNCIKAKRHGLMKLALQTGAALVPVYVFGGNDFYHQLAPKYMEKLSRFVKAGMTLFWGQYGLPMPYPAKCSIVLGDPIYPWPETWGEGQSGTKKTCRKIQNPTKEQIDELLERYTQCLHRLFEQYKVQAGYPDAQLEIQ